jgi:hypothetical protein
MPIGSPASMTRKPLGYPYGSAEPFVIVNWQAERHPVLSRTLAPCRLAVTIRRTGWRSTERDILIIERVLASSA